MYEKPNVDPFHHAELVKDGLYYQYTTSADPVSAGFITKIPCIPFLHTLHEEGDTRIIPLDISKELQTPYPATSPALLANFVRIKSGEHIDTSCNATSQIFYVIRGNGHTEVGDKKIPWNSGDFFVLPSCSPATHYAEIESAFYYVHDEPLLSFLGATATKARFEPTLYVAETAFSELQKVIEQPGSTGRNRLSVLLANANFPQTRTITHVLWAMFGVLPANEVQQPHRHQSVAIDFAVECQPGCYTLIGEKINAQGEIVNPIRVDWSSNSVFITPPGHWHSHHNESGVQAHVIPLQDAGLHTYLRSLNIIFSGPNMTNFVG